VDRHRLAFRSSENSQGVEGRRDFATNRVGPVTLQAESGDSPISVQFCRIGMQDRVLSLESNAEQFMNELLMLIQVLGK
jgi:hypothetical protein